MIHLADRLYFLTSSGENRETRSHVLKETDSHVHVLERLEESEARFINYRKRLLVLRILFSSHYITQVAKQFTIECRSGDRTHGLRPSI